MVPEENSRLAGLLCGASFSVSLEGVHGVSAQGRAHTIQAAIADTTKHEDLVIPGHVQPLQARSGGVLARSGRTDASVDLAQLGRLQAGGGDLPDPGRRRFGGVAAGVEATREEQHLKIVSVASLIAYRLRNESLVRRVAEEEFPTHSRRHISRDRLSQRSRRRWSIWRWSKAISTVPIRFWFGSIPNV